MTQHPPTILITRPHGQKEYLMAACRKLGFIVKHLPCIAIEPIAEGHDLAQKIDVANSILFTSRNAVLYAHALNSLPWPNKSVQAIGSATAQALSELGQDIQFQPSPPFNSESYLRQVDDINPTNLLIVKGVGGRDLIETQLTDRGWNVRTADVYQRLLPLHSQEDIDTVFAQPRPTIVSITSNEALKNLVILAQNHWEYLQHLPLVVNSQRCLELAQSLGFTQTANVASQAGDDGQLVVLKQWLKTH